MSDGGKKILMILDKACVSKQLHMALNRGLGTYAPEFRVFSLHVRRMDGGPPVEVIGLDRLAQADHDKVMSLVEKYGSRDE